MKDIEVMIRKELSECQKDSIKVLSNQWAKNNNNDFHIELRQILSMVNDIIFC